MKRLTERFSNGQAAVYGCGSNCKYDYKYCNNHLEDCPTINEIYEKLATYEDAEEQGLLLRLPCSVGSTVWLVGNEFVNDYEVRRYIVDETGVDCVQIAKEIDVRDYWNSFSIDDIGKTVFLTKEEAEQTLKHTDNAR